MAVPNSLKAFNLSRRIRAIKEKMKLTAFYDYCCHAIVRFPYATFSSVHYRIKELLWWTCLQHVLFSFESKTILTVYEKNWVNWILLKQEEIGTKCQLQNMSLDKLLTRYLVIYLIWSYTFCKCQRAIFNLGMMNFKVKGNVATKEIYQQIT